MFEIPLLLKLILTLGFSVGAGVLYRMGGSGKYDTKVRDMGCPTVAILTFLLWNPFHLSLILCWGAMFGAMTTYWDFVNKWLPVEDKGREYWWNWALHAFGLSLAMIFYTIFKHNWIGFIVSSIINIVGITLWSEKIGNAVWEERGRGFINNIRMALLAIKF